MILNIAIGKKNNQSNVGLAVVLSPDNLLALEFIK